MKKKLLIALFMLIGTLLAACSGNTVSEEPEKDNNDNNNQAEEKVEIEFWHAMNGPHEELLNSLVDEFNQKHENMTVKPVNQGGYQDLEQKIMAAAKAKTLPTIAQAVPQMIPEYIDNNFVVPLNDFMKDEEIGLSDEQINDYIEIFRESSQWDGTYYSMPFSKSTRLLFYNEEILAEHQLEAPKTWEDVRKIAETVTGDGIIGMGFENSYESEFQALLKQMGGEYIDEGANEAKFASEAGVKAMTFIKEMIDDGIARTAGEDNYMSGPFSRGDVAMFIGSSAGIPHVETAAEGNIKWTTTTTPTFEGNAATTFLGNDLVMFNQASESEQKAGWEFLKFMTSPEVTAKWSMESGYLPVRHSAQELDDFKKFTEENPEFKAGLEQFDSGFFIARIQGGNAVRNVMLETLDKILLDEVSVEDGLKDAQEQANEIFSKK